ncbi:hypothetical protein [Thermosphaera sp.]|uniref:Uncharacterized protein n=1 Tax=Thermosphaera aggregans TaxID=54254 RepID=A0A7C2BJY0_9CREN
MTHLPFMASGKIVNSYELLYKYYDACRGLKGMDCGPIPSSEDLKELETLVKQEEAANLGTLIDYFSNKYMEKIQDAPAQMACRGFYGRDVDMTHCRNKIAQLIALWLIEIADNLGIISLKFAWKEGA